jgi:hypothetical protein
MGEWNCQVDHSFHQYTVAGDGRPMTVGQCLDYVLQQDIDELSDLVKRLITTKTQNGVKDDKKRSGRRQEKFGQRQEGDGG